MINSTGGASPINLLDLFSPVSGSQLGGQSTSGNSGMSDLIGLGGGSSSGTPQQEMLQILTLILQILIENMGQGAGAQQAGGSQGGDSSDVGDQSGGGWDTQPSGPQGNDQQSLVGDQNADPGADPTPDPSSDPSTPQAQTAGTNPGGAVAGSSPTAGAATSPDPQEGADKVKGIPGGFKTGAELKAWCKAHPDDLVLPGGYVGPNIKPQTNPLPWMAVTPPGGAKGNAGDNAFVTGDPKNPGGKYGILKGVPYGTQIENAALSHNINPIALAKIGFNESRLNPDQPSGGMFQLEDQYWRPPGYNATSAFDPLENANAASEVLGSLYENNDPTSGDHNTLRTVAVWNNGPEQAGTANTPTGLVSNGTVYRGQQINYLQEFLQTDAQLKDAGVL